MVMNTQHPGWMRGILLSYFRRLGTSDGWHPESGRKCIGGPDKRLHELWEESETQPKGTWTFGLCN